MLSAYVQKCCNMAKNNNTNSSSTLGAMLQQLCKGLSGESQRDDFQFLKGAQEVHRVQRGSIDWGWPISTPKEVLHVRGPLLLARLTYIQWLMQVITPLEQERKKTCLIHVLKHPQYLGMWFYFWKSSWNRNLKSELFLPLMLIQITGLPGNTVKVVPSQTQFDTLTVGTMQAGKKKEDHSFILFVKSCRHMWTAK